MWNGYYDCNCLYAYIPLVSFAYYTCRIYIALVIKPQSKYINTEPVMRQPLPIQLLFSQSPPHFMRTWWLVLR